MVDPDGRLGYVFKHVYGAFIDDDKRMTKLHWKKTWLMHSTVNIHLKRYAFLVLLLVTVQFSFFPELSFWLELEWFSLFHKQSKLQSGGCWWYSYFLPLYNNSHSHIHTGSSSKRNTKKTQRKGRARQEAQSLTPNRSFKGTQHNQQHHPSW